MMEDLRIVVLKEIIERIENNDLDNDLLNMIQNFIDKYDSEFCPFLFVSRDSPFYDML